MRLTTRSIFAALIGALAWSACAASASTAGDTSKVQADAEQSFRWAQSGHFDRSKLTVQANELLTSSLARGVAKHLQAMGKPKSFTLMGSETLPKTTDYTFLVRFAHSRLNWFVAYDRQGKLAGILFYPSDERMPQTQLLAAADDKGRRAAASDAFSGTLLVAKNGKPIFQRAYGYADRARKIRNTLNTRFRIGSMNKMITAIAILQLVQAGKISLDDTLDKYLPDYPNKQVATNVTVHELLTHTGGTGDIFGPEFDKNRLKLRTLQDYIDLYGSRGLRFRPGSKWEYSNYGFVLLGRVIERTSGQNYYDYVREHVYVPAGMTSTGSEPEDEIVPNRSVGYMKSDGRWVPNTNTLPYRGMSAGGGYSTVGDLLKFSDALLAHKLLNTHYTELLVTPKVHANMLLNYGYGFAVKWENGVPCFGHTGGAPGMNGDLVVCPSLGYTIIALSNLDPPAAEKMSSFIAWRLPLPSSNQ